MYLHTHTRSPRGDPNFPSYCRHAANIRTDSKVLSESKRTQYSLTCGVYLLHCNIVKCLAGCMVAARARFFGNWMEFVADFNGHILPIAPFLFPPYLLLFMDQCMLPLTPCPFFVRDSAVHVCPPSLPYIYVSVSASVSVSLSLSLCVFVP